MASTAFPAPTPCLKMDGTVSLESSTGHARQSVVDATVFDRGNL